MSDSLFDRPSFRPASAFLLLALAALLLHSWANIASVRILWDAADRAVFFTLNGSLADGIIWQNIWAIGNAFAGDIVMGIFVTALFYLYALSGKADQIIARLSTFLLLATTAILAKFAMRFLSGGKRTSASVELEPVVLISEKVTWLETKDVSYDCFPSDHGTLLFLAVAFMFFFAGRRFGLAMLVVALVFILPRLFSGAHWFTDMFVGSLTVALVASALVLCTPFHKALLNGFVWAFDRPLFLRVLKPFFPALRQGN